MTGDLLINTKDAYTTFGINMGDDFIETLLTPPPMKALVSNNSPLEHGSRVTGAPFTEEREITLAFVIEANSQEDYITKYKAFMTELKLGYININVPPIGAETYKLVYLECPVKPFGKKFFTCKLSLKFKEPNTEDR